MATWAYNFAEQFGKGHPSCFTFTFLNVYILFHLFWMLIPKMPFSGYNTHPLINVKEGLNSIAFNIAQQSIGAT